MFIERIILAVVVIVIIMWIKRTGLRQFLKEKKKNKQFTHLLHTRLYVKYYNTSPMGQLYYLHTTHVLTSYSTKETTAINTIVLKRLLYANSFLLNIYFLIVSMYIDPLKQPWLELTRQRQLELRKRRVCDNFSILYAIYIT